MPYGEYLPMRPLLSAIGLSRPAPGEVELWSRMRNPDRRHAVDDAGIVAQVGADATIGDGSLYVSHVDGAGALFQKRNDVWVDTAA